MRKRCGTRGLPPSPRLTTSSASTASTRASSGWTGTSTRRSARTRLMPLEDLEADAKLAGELGFDAEYLESVPLVGRPGVRYADQARIHPRGYLAGVAKALVALGGRIHEHSEADEFCDNPRGVKANGHTVTCEDVVIATHNPLVGFGGMAGATLFQTKLALYTSYVIAGRVARGVVPDALWWDTAEPYQFLRVEPHRDRDVVIFGGEDHKTGQQDDTEACYRRLEERLRTLVPDVDLTHRWSGQVIETPDGLPYIGQSAEHQYSASGYAGNGLTFGTLAGLMISDAILERSNPWRGAVRSGSKGAHPRPLGLPEGERRLSVLPDSRSVCRRRGEIPSCGKTRSGTGHRTKWREGRRVSRPNWHRHAALRHLHAHGLRGGLEYGRANMGLPVPWVTLQADRRRDLRPGRGATVRSGVRRAPHCTL